MREHCLSSRELKVRKTKVTPLELVFKCLFVRIATVLSYLPLLTCSGGSPGVNETRSFLQSAMNTKSYCLIISALVGQMWLSTTAGAADGNEARAADLLPTSVIAYAEIISPTAIINTILEHPISHKVQEDPAFEPLMSSKEMNGFKAGVGVFQASIGMRWRKLLGELTQEPLSIAFDAETSGVVILTKASSQELLQRLRATVFSFLRAGNPAGSEDDPIKEAEYKGFEAARINDDVAVAIVGEWLLLTNKPELGKSIIDRYVANAEGAESLAQNPRFVEARTETENDRGAAKDGWAFVDIEKIRDSGTADEFYSGKTDNLLAEVLFGGIVSNMQQTSHASFKLLLKQTGITLTLCTPYDQDWIPEERDYFFGPSGEGSAPALVDVPEKVLSLAAYRNMSEMWLRASDLVKESAVDDIDQADSQLNLFLSGQDFGEDFLASFGPEWRVYASRPNFENAKLRPAIKVPAFAIELRMNSPEATAKIMRRLYLNFVGFINIISAMEGQPQFDFDFDEDENTRYLMASFVELPEVPIASNISELESPSANGPINYNFSPTLAIQGQRLIISSTSELARTLANAGSNPTEEPKSVAESIRNTVLEVQAKPILDLLSDNFDQLVSQNMLEKGHSREEAENEIGLLLKILEFIEKGEIELSTRGNVLELSVNIGVPAK